MFHINRSSSIFLLVLVLSSSCASESKKDNACKLKNVTEEFTQDKYAEQHPYGGWFCPDNLNGFPPVNPSELDLIPVVTDRLPTQEETRNGTSLMFIDQEKYPDAKPYDMDLPRLAKIHSRHNDMEELIILIQALIIGNDTVVGYRFPAGGNGSAWLGEVTVLNEEQVSEIGNAPYVFLEEELNASKKEVWKALANSSYGDEIGEKFNEKEFMKSEWSSNANLHLSLESAVVHAQGIIADTWGNLYIHIDYQYQDFIYSEKIMVSESEEGKASIQLVAGPYPKDFSAEKEKWMARMNEITAGI